MAHGIQEMRDIILQDYAKWWHRGNNTGIWRQEGIIMMRGVAGCGKTEILFQLSELLKEGIEKMGLPALPQASPPVQLFFNAAMDPESIAGTPAPTRLEIKARNLKYDPSQPESDKNPLYVTEEKLALTMHYRQELLLPMQYAPGAILFCDEMGRDAPHMRAAQLKLLSPEKTLAGLDMNHFYIVCAGNPADEQHRVDDIMADAAMASRLIPFEINPTVKEWSDYMYNRAAAENNPTFREVANFIIDNTSLFVGRDDDNNPNSPFHNPRAWTVAASRLHDHGGGTDEKCAKMESKTAIGFVSGTVGPQAASALQAYMNQNRPMTLSAILKGRFKVDKNGRIPDGVAPSAVRNLQDYMERDKLTDDEAKNVAKFCRAIPADIAHGITRNNRSLLPANLAKLAQNNAFGDILNRVKKMSQYTQDSGNSQ